MNNHENARLTLIGRERLAMAVLRGQTPEAARRDRHDGSRCATSLKPD